MNTRIHIKALLAICALAGPLAAQVPIPWSSLPRATNLTSGGQIMNSAFVFELGVFTGAFVPTPENTGEWAENWNPAAQTNYNAENKLFSAVHQATNTGPFTSGKPAYVWGKRAGHGADEWILFRSATWNWPNAAMPSPALDPWQADSATAIIGTINSSGSPFLMQSASVPNGTPPLLTWADWRNVALEDIAENGPNDDPDRDGVPNLMEFAFGSDPRVPGPPPSLPVSKTRVGDADYLSMRVPRPVDRAVEVGVQVSDDLKVWKEGSEYVALVEDGPQEFVFRDLTAITATSKSRFMRLVLRLPEN